MTGAILVIVLNLGLAASVVVDNPYASPDSCGLSQPGYICDREGVLDDGDRKRIARQLNSFNSDNVCGMCLAVAVIPMIRSNIPQSQAHTETKALVQQLTEEQWRFPNCRSIAVLIVNTKQRYVWFEPGKGSKLCSSIGSMFSHNKLHFARRDYGKGIEAIIATYAKGFNAKYENQGDCNLDSYPCAKGEVSLDQLQRLLPDPSSDRSTCQLRKGDYVCDPEKTLTDADRADLAKTLSQINSENECGQCIIVALLNTAKGSPKALKQLADGIVKRDWPYRKCKAKLLILVAKEQGFTWIQGTDKTMYCRELGNIFAKNKQYFTSGDIYSGVMAIAGSYYEAVSSTKDCMTDICAGAGGRKTGSKGGKGKALGGIGGSVKGKVLKYVMSHKMLILGLIVGILALLACLACVGCVCCRETMMNTVRSAGSAAKKHGPGLVSGFRGGGRGSSAQYTKGDMGGGGTATWGAGGSWGETPAPGHGGGGTWEESGDTEVGYRDPHQSSGRDYRGGGGGGGF